MYVFTCCFHILDFFNSTEDTEIYDFLLIFMEEYNLHFQKVHSSLIRK